MDLAGIEPASESLSIQASPITVILLTFPQTTAGWQAAVLSSFMISFFLSKLWEKSAPPDLMPKSELREIQATTATIRQRTLNFRLRLNLISRFLTRSQSRGWLPKLRNPRRNQYKPEDLYGFQKSSECSLLSAYSVYSKCRCLSSCITVLHLQII